MDMQGSGKTERQRERKKFELQESKYKCGENVREIN
jgi:hypothetical protein